MASGGRGLDAALDGAEGRRLMRQGTRWPVALAALLWALPASAAEPDWSAQWEAFLKQADLRQVASAYQVLTAIDPDGSGGDADRCLEYAGELRAAREVNPFSIALQAQAERCATALDDARLQAQEHARSEALRAWLLADGRGAIPQQPIPVAAEADASALVISAGWTPLYGRYTVGASNGSLPFVAVYYDEAAGQERQLHFDMLSLWQRIDREHGDHQYPAFLLQRVQRYLEGGVAAGNVAAELAQVTTQLGRQEIPLDQAIEQIQALALGGSAAAAFELLPLCLMSAQSASCGKEALGLVRAHAERGLAEGMLVMALAADRRIDGAGGRHARAQWLARARERLGTGVALTAYAQLAISVEPGRRIGAAAAEALRTAVQADHAPAAVILAQLIRSERVRARRGESADRLLRRALALGSVPAQTQLGLDYLRNRRYEEAWPLLERSVAADDASAMALMAIGLDSGKVGLASDPVRALALYQQAAVRGNAGAMRRLGRAWQRGELGLKPDIGEAEAWLLSAALFGNERAAVELAELYLSGTAGVYGRPEDGYAVIEKLAADGMQPARLRLAMAMLLGQGVKANVEAALALLVKLEAEGSAGAAFRLGQIREFGQGGVEIDWVEARKHYARAAEAGSAEAMDYYARSLYAGRGGAEDRKQAVDWWQRAADLGHAPAINNLAWTRCASREPTLRDPVQGTRLISELLARAPSPNLEDTLAACLAANGQFEQAIATQQRVVQAAEADPHTSQGTRAAYQARLASYERREAWYE